MLPRRVAEDDPCFCRTPARSILRHRGRGISDMPGRCWAPLAMVVLALLPQGAAAGPTTPEDGAEAFYKVYLKLGTVDGVPGQAARAKLAPVVTDGLMRLLVAADKAEQRHYKATKGQEPPMIEGDLFTSLFEGAAGYEVASCETLGESAVCAITLSADDGKGGTFTWTDQAVTAHVGDRWRLDNIKFGGTWAFGIHGDLRTVLTGVINDK